MFEYLILIGWKVCNNIFTCRIINYTVNINNNFNLANDLGTV